MTDSQFISNLVSVVMFLLSGALLLVAKVAPERAAKTIQYEAVMLGHARYLVLTNQNPPTIKFEWNTNGCPNINH